MTERKAPKAGTQAAIFLAIAQPNDRGESRDVYADELPPELSLGNGAGWLRETSYLARHYIIAKRRSFEPHGKILAVRLEGFKPDESPDSATTPPPKRIVDEIRKQTCAVLGIGAVEVDHKAGRGRGRRKDPDDYDLDDFQALSRAVNKAKRQHCASCRQTDLRFDARRLGYPHGWVAGGEEYEGTCVGCYWHDPQAFNKASACPAD